MRRACSTSSALPAPIESGHIWELLRAVPGAELLNLGMALAAFEPLGAESRPAACCLTAARTSRCSKGWPSLLRDLVLA